LDRVLVPEVSVLLKKRSSSTSDCVCLTQNTVLRGGGGGTGRPEGPKYFQGSSCPPTSRAYVYMGYSVFICL